MPEASRSGVGNFKQSGHHTGDFAAEWGQYLREYWQLRRDGEDERAKVLFRHMLRFAWPFAEDNEGARKKYSELAGKRATIEEMDDVLDLIHYALARDRNLYTYASIPEYQWGPGQAKEGGNGAAEVETPPGQT